MSRHRNPSERERAYRDMKIEHITYDHTHSSSSSKGKERESTERPVTQWPVEYSSSPRPPKAWGQRAKVDENINKAAEIQEPPTLHRKSRLENIKDKFSRRSGEGKKDPYTDLRAAIRAGKLEQVVPPKAMQESWREATPTPRSVENTSRPPPRHRFYDERPSTSHNTSRLSTSQDRSRGRGTSRTRKTQSASSTIKENFLTGVDVADETRREIQSKLASRFPLSRKRTERMDFVCVGVDTNDFEEQPRLSGEGISPWEAKTYLGHCRLCKKPVAASVRGLCGECERDFRRPESPENKHGEVEVKPTPPLKDKKSSLPRKERAIPRSRFAFEDEEDEEDLRPIVPPKNNEKIRLGNSTAEMKTTLQPVVFRQSFRAEVEDGDDDHRYTRWQKDMVRSEKPKPKGNRYQSGRNVPEQDDRVPLIPKRGSPGQSSRNTSFYGFYDEVIGDYSGAQGKDAESRRDG